MLKVTGLVKSYRDQESLVHAVKGVGIEPAPGAFYTLLGPSGCGKSTTLRCIGGLEEPDAGRIELGGEVIYSSAEGINVPSYRRGVGMVFQSYAIWPHMTVFDNVAFPLVHGQQRLPSRQVREKVLNALSLVRLEGLENRPAPFLSGGQQQRVALARAMAYEPGILLLDEPLSNLDAKLRAEMRLELKELVRRVGITTLYVTHDQIEALSMSDCIAVMYNGLVVQEGTPRELYLSPESSFVANFLGQINIFHGSVIRAETRDGLFWLDTEHGRLGCHGPGRTPAGETSVGVRPEAMTLHTHPPEADGNVIEGTVEHAIFVGDALEVKVRCGSQLVQARADALTTLEPRGKVFLQFAHRRTHLLSLEQDAAAADGPAGC